MQRLKTSNSEWWCSGFYPGTLFYLYEDTGDKELYAEGVRMLKLLEPEQYNVNTHDVGFMMYCSYGNANRIAPKPEYKDIMVNSARSLISRFSPVVGCIKSHNRKPDRGQAWGLYGYTLMYRFTKERKYLEQAIKIAEFTLNHPNMPKDLIPYWDYNAPGIPDALRDASAAAINCSGLLELSQYVSEERAKKYYKAAEKMLQTLSSPAYTAEEGTNGGFILKHSVGNIPSGTEVDMPLTYADYYYVEALCRYKSLNDKP